MIKVLIIDDEPNITIVLRRLLEKQADFEVTTVNSASEGIETVRQQEPDVIVLDLMMPGMSGWEACRAIRAFSQTPILILSAVINSDKVLRALDEGANDYLIKPVAQNVLASHIRMLAK